jgi:5'-nucleotidase
MPESLTDKLIIAISSRALFDLEESHRVYVDQGVDAYSRYQIEHEGEVLRQGVAFPLVQKLLALNLMAPARERVEVVLTSRNSADTGLRVFSSIQHYRIDIARAVFSGGESPFRYMQPLGTHLFLSADPADVRAALEAGFAAATIVPGQASACADEQLRIAFDGDAVLFGDVAERVYKRDGLEEFNRLERGAAGEPLPGGPFKGFLAALHQIQSEFPPKQSPIRTALVTARAAPAHERVIRTLRAWQIRIDEALFLGGKDKGEFLKAFQADVFFDDQRRHVDSAARHVASGHVPFGVANEPEKTGS